ncbi:hypothetical protein FRC17_003633, partial [Serendipita sp. 399]
MDIEQILPADKIVLVMGLTGSGKSTFINFASGGDGMAIGHGLNAFTETITITRVSFQSDRVDQSKVLKDLKRCYQADQSNGNSTDEFTGAFVTCFVDTPGLTDEYLPDLERLQMISDFVIAIRKRNLQLDAIIYLHQILDNGPASSPLKYLRLLAGLCDNESLPNVVLVTTMWSLLSNREVGWKRQADLERDFWASMIQAGCMVAIFDDTHDPAFEVTLKQKSLPKAVFIPRDVIGRTEEKGTRSTLNKRLKELLNEKKALSESTKGSSRLQGKKNARELEDQMRTIDNSIAGVRAKLRDVNPHPTGNLPGFIKKI